MYEADSSHDKFLIVMEENKVRLLDFGIMLDHYQPKHQCTYNIGDWSSCLSDLFDELWSNGKRVGYAQ